MDLSTGTHCNPSRVLGSILRSSPASPGHKVRAALILVHGDRESQGTLARRLGYPREYLVGVISGKRVSAPARQAVATYLGVEEADIWAQEARQVEGEAAAPRVGSPEGAGSF